MKLSNVLLVVFCFAAIAVIVGCHTKSFNSKDRSASIGTSFDIQNEKYLGLAVINAKGQSVILVFPANDCSLQPAINLDHKTGAFQILMGDQIQNVPHSFTYHFVSGKLIDKISIAPLECPNASSSYEVSLEFSKIEVYLLNQAKKTVFVE